MTSTTVLSETLLRATTDESGPVLATLPVGSTLGTVTGFGPNDLVQAYASTGYIGWASTVALGPLTRLMPAAADLPDNLAIAQDVMRSVSDVAATFPNPAEVEQTLNRWRLSQNAFRQFLAATTAPAMAIAGVEISIYTFGEEEGSISALEFFSQERATALDLESSNSKQWADQSRYLDGYRPDGLFEATFYVRVDQLLGRVTALSQESTAAAELAEALTAALVRATTPGAFG